MKKKFNMESIFIFKILVLLVSTTMFVYQFTRSLSNLLNPMIADTTVGISREDLPLPLITICPLNQLNKTKIKDLGYDANEWENFLYGIKEINHSLVITWGSDLNKTFDQLLYDVLDANDVSTGGLHVSLIKNGNFYSGKYMAHLKRKFYIGFWGYCWELEDYDIQGSLYIVNNLKTVFEVFITEKSMKSYYSVSFKSQLGQYLTSDATKRIWYEINMHKYSNKVTGRTTNCADYENAMYEDCVEEKIESLVKPDIGCNPPWISKKTHCKNEILPITTEKKKSYSRKLNPFVFRDDIQVIYL